jgi:hypothetical protein
VVEGLQRQLAEAIASRESFDEVQVVPDDLPREELKALGYID